jgi:uridine phosphorylase
MGVKRIILLGNCGVLDSNIRDCGIIIPTKAIRDEGTSYHYAPAADYTDVNKKYVDEFVAVLEERGYPMSGASSGPRMPSIGKPEPRLRHGKPWGRFA